jgi:hypothetical protein
VRTREGVLFEIRVIEGFKPSVVGDITAGLMQEDHVVKFMADEWDEKAGRAPEKGDQITFKGKRHAIQDDPRSRGIADTTIIYVVRVRG